MSDEERARMTSPGGWGEVGSEEDQRYAKPITSRRRCRCGCNSYVTHTGMANGMALMSGCHLSVRRWVREP